MVGAVRCFQYNRERGEPLMVEATPRPRTAEEVWRCVTEARWRQYQAGGHQQLHDGPLLRQAPPRGQV